MFSSSGGSGGLRAQTFDNFLVGSNTDVEAKTDFGILLAGGGRDSDAAMRWFGEKAPGGDVLILRASGSDGYNRYLFSELGLDFNSVETIVFRDASAANEEYIAERIRGAEAIFFAGGDQTVYVNDWTNTPVQTLIQEKIDKRTVVIGGTSAGMAILGGHVYAPERDGVTSSEALGDPFHPNLAGLSTTPFLSLPFLSGTVTDTHFQNRSRQGRSMVFMARTQGQAISVNERTAVGIGASGTAVVFGDADTGGEDAYAYFLQPGCGDPSGTPEKMAAGEALNWNRDRKAVAAYRVEGFTDGRNSFDLNDWTDGSGGNWQDWYVAEGRFRFSRDEGTPVSECAATGVSEWVIPDLKFGPSPTPGIFFLLGLPEFPASIELLDANGRTAAAFPTDQIRFDFSARKPGLYYLRLTHASGTQKLVRFVKL